MGDDNVDNIKDINDDDKFLDEVAAKKTADERAQEFLDRLKDKK